MSLTVTDQRPSQNRDRRQPCGRAFPRRLDEDHGGGHLRHQLFHKRQWSTSCLYSPCPPPPPPRGLHARPWVPGGPSLQGRALPRVPCAPSRPCAPVTAQGTVQVSMCLQLTAQTSPALPGPSIRALASPLWRRSFCVLDCRAGWGGAGAAARQGACRPGAIQQLPTDAHSVVKATAPGLPGDPCRANRFLLSAALAWA